MKTKKCSCCGIEKSLSKFRCFQNKKINGYFDECKMCHDFNFKNKIIKEQGIESWNKWLFDSFKHRVRNRTRSAFRRIKENKPINTEKILGCDWLTAKLYIETFFTNELNWDNFNDWHIDHITPLCSASTIEEIILLSHYTNLQPLMAKDNLKKGGRY